MRTIWRDLFHLFYPPCCYLCGKRLVTGEEAICLSCLRELPRTNEPAESLNPTAERISPDVLLKYACSFLHYEKGSETQRLIHALKYHDYPKLGYVLGRMAALELQRAGSPVCRTDLLIPVPLHASKLRQRGYNQAEQIAKGLQAVWATPVHTNNLVRSHATASQTRQSVFGRWENSEDSFALRHPESLEGKHILLVDDVITTGATLSRCAQTLLPIKNIQISVFALAQA